MAPAYLAELCLPITASASCRGGLRSATTSNLVIPRCRLSTYGTRAFSVAVPVCWNSLPDYLKSYDLSFDCFRQQFKTLLFCKYWHQSQHHFCTSETLLVQSTNLWYLLTYLLESHRPLHCIYNAICWSINPKWAMNAFGYVMITNRAEAEKISPLSQSWEKTVKPERSPLGTAPSLTIHRITGSKETTTLLNRCGVGIPYTDVPDLNNRWAKNVTMKHKSMLPPGFILGRSVQITFDNWHWQEQKPLITRLVRYSRLFMQMIQPLPNRKSPTSAAWTERSQTMDHLDRHFRTLMTTTRIHHC